MGYTKRLLYNELLLQIGNNERDVLKSLDYCFIRERKITNYISALFNKKANNDFKWIYYLIYIDIYLTERATLKIKKEKSYYSKLNIKYEKFLKNLPKAFTESRDSFFKSLKFKEGEFPELVSKEIFSKFLQEEFVKIEQRAREKLKSAWATETFYKNSDKISKRNTKSYYFLTSIFTLGYFSNQKLVTNKEIVKLYKKPKGKSHTLCDVIVSKYNGDKFKAKNKMPTINDISQNGLINQLSNPMASSLIESHGLNFKNRQAIYSLCDHLQKLIEEKKEREFILILLIALTIKYEASLFINSKDYKVSYEADKKGIYFYCKNKAQEDFIKNKKVYLISYGTFSIVTKHFEEYLDVDFK